MFYYYKRDGATVLVICSPPFYPEWKVKRTNKEIEGVKIIRGKVSEK